MCSYNGLIPLLHTTLKIFLSFPTVFKISTGFSEVLGIIKARNSDFDIAVTLKTELLDKNTVLKIQNLQMS